VEPYAACTLDASNDIHQLRMCLCELLLANNSAARGKGSQITTETEATLTTVSVGIDIANRSFGIVLKPPKQFPDGINYRRHRRPAPPPETENRKPTTDSRQPFLPVFPLFIHSNSASRTALSQSPNKCLLRRCIALAILPSLRAQTA
jgi:hypothetical protein